MACRQFITKKEAAIAFAISAFTMFYIIKLTSTLGPTIYSTVYRVTYIQTFNQSVTSSFVIDDMIIVALSLFTFTSLSVSTLRKYFVASSITLFGSCLVGYFIVDLSIHNIVAFVIVPAFIGALVINKITCLRIFSTKVSTQTVLIATTILLTIFEFAGLFRWLASAIVFDRIYGDQITWWAAALESQIFYVLGRLSPPLMLLLVYSFLIKPYIGSIWIFISAKLRFLSSSFTSETDVNSKLNIANTGSKVHIYQALLITSLVLGAVLPIYPYLPNLNPDFKDASVDVSNYLNWVGQLHDASSMSIIIDRAFSEVNFGDRPFTVLLLLALEQITNIPLLLIIRFLPVVLGPLLVLVTYFFVKYGTGNNIKAAFAALLTVVSFHFIVGLYGGFLANWLALITGGISIIFLLRSWKHPASINFAIFGAATAITLFIHTYTWTYLIASIIAFIAISYVINRKDHSNLRIVLILVSIVAINITIDIAKMSHFGTGGGLERDLVLVQDFYGPDQFVLRWNNLQYAFHIYVGGYLTNSVLLILSLIWVLKAKYSNSFDRIILSYIFVGAIPIIFGDFVMQTRIFYNMPIHIPAALLLYELGTSKKVHPILSYGLISVILIHLFNYAMRALSNFYLVVGS